MFLIKMGWDEIEIERLIKSNRNFLDREIGKEYELPPLFINPTKENPVETSEFLLHLNLTFLHPILEKNVSEVRKNKERRVCKGKISYFYEIEQHTIYL